MDSIKKYLVSSGYNIIAANAYIRFIEATLGALYKAEKRLNHKSAWNDFIVKDGAFNKLQKYSGLATEIAIPSEVAITTELKPILDSLRKECASDDLLRDLDIFFEVEVPTPSKTKTGIKSNRIDIRAKSFRKEFELEMVYEAKNITTESDVKNKYLSADGILCLLRKSEPYSKMPISGMIAYTVKGSRKKWAEKIINNIDSTFKTKKLSKSLSHKNKQVKSTLLSIFEEDNSIVEKTVIHLIFKFKYA